MNDGGNPQTGAYNSTKRGMLAWIIGGCVGIAAVVALVYVLTTPPTPAEAAEQHIEDHYDAVAEAVVHTAFPDSPFKAKIIAEVAESIAEQVVPYNCRETVSAGVTVDTRCNLSFSMDRPMELRIDAPLRVSMSTTDKDIFGRAVPMVQDSNPIISEMTVNGLNLEKFKEAQAAVGDVKESISEAGAKVEDARDTISEAGAEIKDLLPDQGAMPTGRLPADFPTGPRHPKWSGPEVMTPDEFRDIVHLHRKNTVQLLNRFGDRRILVSGWTDSVAGTAPPIVTWSNGATCPAETDATNLEAIAALNLDKEVLVSGHINYDFNTQPRIHFMTDCRIHGYYDLGYHHAIPLETR